MADAPKEGRATRWWKAVSGAVDWQDVLSFGGIAALAWGFGLDTSAGWIAAGVGMFYLGAVHPLLWIVVAQRGE